MINSWFTIKQVEKNIWGIAEFGHFEKAISYLIVGKNKTLLFDTGLGIGNIKAVVKSITVLPTIVINSHSHFDHLGGNKYFKEIYIPDCTVRKNVAKTGYGKSYLKQHMTELKFDKQPPKGFDKKKYQISPFSWTKIIVDNESVRIDPYDFRIIFTPGHSPDSICLQEKNLGFLFSGDTIYPGPIYLHLPESDLADYTISINRIISLNKINQIFPGHNHYTCSSNIIKKIADQLSNIKNNDKKGEIKIDETTSLII